MADQVGTALARGSTLGGGGTAGAGNELAEQGSFMGEWLSAAQVIERKKMIGRVVEGVMEKDVHYGTLPGARKPCLYKPGAEALAATFALAVEYIIEDVGAWPDLVRYRVRCRVTSQGNSVFLGEGVGECSSEEDAKKWRRVKLWEEYDATHEHERRQVFTRDREKGEPVMERQVRQYPPDVANAVLKVAKKRAYLDGVLTATGASDFFEQDTADDPTLGGGTAGVVAAVSDADKKAEARGAAAKAKLPSAFVAKPAPAVATAPAPASTPAADTPTLLTLEEESAFLELLHASGAPPNALELILGGQGVSSIRQLAREKYEMLIKSLEARIVAIDNARMQQSQNENTGG